jgi:hypothetical protein
MGLDWNIHINGQEPDHKADYGSWPKVLRCNGMVLDHYLDGTTAHMVSDLGLDPYYPLWPSEMKDNFRPTKTTIDAEDMGMIADLIGRRATCAEHMRIAAWLWSWAEQDQENERITLHLSY